MKKSLSILVAGALVSSMFSSVAFAADTKMTTEQKYEALVKAGIFEGFDDGEAHLDRTMKRSQAAKIVALLAGYKEGAEVADAGYTDLEGYTWAANYINYATQVGVLEGKGNGKFDPGAEVTIQQLAKIVVTLAEDAGIKVPAGEDVEGKVAAWAAEDVASAVAAGLLAEQEDYTADAQRALLVDVTYAAVEAIEASQVATTVKSVTATNLKEIVVAFDGSVDKTTAENKDAYIVTKGIGSVALDSATLQADGKTVVLVPTAALTNQASDYTLTVSGVKAGSAVINVKDIAFKPVDAALPTVESVVSLGNKAVKLTFSEPVQLASTVASTFKIDDKVVSGTATVSGRTVIIQLFNTLTAGQHSVTANNNVRDFQSYQLVEVTNNFDVVADTTAPTIASVKDATLEGVTVVFSEDVQDAQALDANNFLWKQGSTDKVATSVTKIDSKTFKVAFSTNKLPGYATDLFVKNVQDFSGNVIAADSKISVTAQLDQARPEVLSAVFDEVNKNKLTLTLNKNIDTTSFSASNVVVKDKDGKVVSNGYTANIVGKSVVINFSSALAVGTYSLEVSGLKDTTLLANSMLPYTLNVIVKNTTAPVAAAEVTGAYPNYIISFDKAMDTSSSASILNVDNYYITYNTATTNNITGKLPAGTNLAPTNGNKGVIITLPSGITAVTQLVVQGVKDADGNILSGFSKTYTSGDIESLLKPSAAQATGAKSVQVKFNQPVGAVDYHNFAVSSNTVTAASVDASDNTIVNLTLGTALVSNPSVTVSTTASVNTQGVTGATLATTASVAVADAIAPSIKKNVTSGLIEVGASNGLTQSTVTTTNDTLTITFDENIKVVNQSTVGSNFKVYRADGIQLTYGLDYTIAPISGSAATVVITLNTNPATNANLAGYDGNLNVVFDNSNGNIKDVSGSVNFSGNVFYNNAAGFNTATDLTSGAVIPVDAKVPTAALTAPAAGALTTLTVTFNEPLATATTSITDINALLASATNDGAAISVVSAANSVTWVGNVATITIPSTTFVTGKAVVLTFKANAVKDAAGNVITTTATATVS